eukprot:2464990-Rhodomonas_salina.1
MPPNRAAARLHTPLPAPISWCRTAWTMSVHGRRGSPRPWCWVCGPESAGPPSDPAPPALAAEACSAGPSVPSQSLPD